MIGILSKSLASSIMPDMQWSEKVIAVSFCCIAVSNNYLLYVIRYFIEYWIFGEGSQISTNQMRQNLFSPKIPY